MVFTLSASILAQLNRRRSLEFDGLIFFIPDHDYTEIDKFPLFMFN
ncbi:MAG: hypothetical protein AB4352_29405 [Hormoscilla sp.]